jgi:hypothetical protein
VLDGEIVYLGKDGCPRFYDLMRPRAPQQHVVQRAVSERRRQSARTVAVTKPLRAEDRNAPAAKHLEQLTKAVLNGDDVYAEKLAMAIAERYGF